MLLVALFLYFLVKVLQVSHISTTCPSPPHKVPNRTTDWSLKTNHSQRLYQLPLIENPFMRHNDCSTKTCSSKIPRARFTDFWLDVRNRTCVFVSVWVKDSNTRTGRGDSGRAVFSASHAGTRGGSRCGSEEPDPFQEGRGSFKQRNTTKVWFGVKDMASLSSASNWELLLVKFSLKLENPRTKSRQKFGVLKTLSPKRLKIQGRRERYPNLK